MTNWHLRSLHEQEPEHRDRWLISYADLITLMLGFFVVMYSMSSVNDGKYRVVTDSIGSAFREPVDIARVMPIDLGGGMQATEPGVEQTGNSSMTANAGMVSELSEVALDSQGANKSRPVEKVKERPPIDDPTDARGILERDLAEKVDEGLFSIRDGEEWLEIELDSELFFNSGSAVLQDAATPVLQDVAEVINAMQGPINVQGHTDNVPIASPFFPSNWELSAARAASVVRYFSEAGLESERLSAIGHGEFQPIADNDTVDGRQRNRRVVIAVAKFDGITVDENAVAQAAAARARAGSGAEADAPPVLVLKRVSGLPPAIGLN
ncbi:MAG: OmpA family protein [Gammaproteobacteria bacterium]|nr:OmpA family protein [Gammaproteobacteria bacterium]